MVGSSSNFGRVHEFATILDAAERLRDQRNIVFLLIGDGHQRDWVENEVNRRGLDNVVMKPRQPREQLAASNSPVTHRTRPSFDIAARPLESCSIPSKLYGILAAGRPTLFIGDLDGEVAQLITEGSCGIPVAIGGADGLARRIVQLAGSEPL